MHLKIFFCARNRSMDEELLGGGEAGGPGGRPGGGQSAERGFPRGGSGARNGLGGYERQTSERGGGWFDRQQSRGAPGEEETNGVASPRSAAVARKSCQQDCEISQ